MKKLLLTGYEPFLNFKTNPTKKVVEALNNQQVGEYEIVTRVYPVQYETVDTLVYKDIDTLKPDIIIHLGLASNIEQLHLERIAINIKDGKPDNNGYRPKNEPIIEDGYDGIFSTLPLERLEENLLHNNIPAVISNSAGTYLCNYLMYVSLYYIQQHHLNIPTGFVHVPANTEIGIYKKTANWPQQYITEAIQTLIECI